MADIGITDDDIDENLKQYFIVSMEVTSATNMDRISNSVDNVTTCTILDNDGKHCHNSNC